MNSFVVNYFKAAVWIITGRRKAWEHPSMLHLDTFGRLDLRTADGTAVESLLIQPKTAALFAYLLLAAPRGFRRRDTLCLLFWPEADETHARGSLRQALNRIRRSAGNDVIDTRGTEEVRVPPGTVACDALAFQEAVEAGDHEGALHLYQGPFLRGFHPGEAPGFEDWVEGERDRLRRMAEGAAMALAKRHLAEGDLVAAEQVALRGIGLGHAGETTVRELMQGLATAGDRVGAIRVYEKWAARLFRELELEPSPEIRMFAGEIRALSGVQPLEKVDPARPRVEATSQPHRRPDPARRFRRRAWLLLPVTLLLLVGVGWSLQHLGGHSVPEPRLVVLPFECLSGGPDDQILAGAIYEDLLTQLQRVRGLVVISRSSAESYRGADKTIPVIGQEPEVDYFLKVKFQRAGSRLRLTLRLIDARTGGHLWAEPFDREMNPEGLPEEILEIQSDIVRAVVGELGYALKEEEWDRAARRSTRDLAAYRLYARGVDAWLRGDGPLAESLFLEATERDPDFLAGQLQVVIVSGSALMYGGRRTPEREAWTRRAAERAVEIDPDSPDAQLAMGIYLYRGPRDYQGALEWLDRAAGTLRNEFSYQVYRSLAERRMGRWHKSLASMDAAISLSAQLPSLRREKVVSLLNLRRYEEAEELLGALIQEEPENSQFPYYHFQVVWIRGGELAPLRAEVERYWLPDSRWEFAMVRGDPRAALAALEDHPEARTGANLWHPRALLAGMAWEAMGEEDRAIESFREAAAILEPMVAQTPGDERYHAALGLAYAGLGRRDEAMKEARTATEILPLERDALSAPFHLLTLASVLARSGEVDEAVRILERLLTRPSRTSAPMLRNHYLFRPIWNEPAFLDLLEREPGRVF